MHLGNYKGNRAYGRSSRRGENGRYELRPNHEQRNGSETTPMDDRSRHRDSRPQRYKEVSSKRTLRHCSSFQNHMPASDERIVPYDAERHEIDERRENKDEIYSRRNKASHFPYNPCNHEKTNRKYSVANSDNFTAVRSTKRSERRENEYQIMTTERNGNEILRNKISSRDRCERNTYRDSDRDINRGTRDNIHNEGNRTDQYRSRANACRDGLRKEKYREEAKRYACRDMDIDDRGSQSINATLAEIDCKSGYSRSDDQYSDKRSTPVDEGRAMNDVFCGRKRYDRGRNKEKDFKRTGGERYIENDRCERNTYIDYKYDNMLENQGKSHIKESETDRFRKHRSAKRDRGRDSRDTENYQKRKRRRLRKEESMASNGNAILNTDLEDGEYRSPERDNPDEQLMKDEQYDQQESVENMSMSNKNSSSYSDWMHIDTEAKSNMNSGDLSPISSKSFSDNEFGNTDLYGGTTSNPDTLVSSSVDVESFRNEFLVTQDNTYLQPIRGKTNYDENESIVQFQSALIAKKRRTLVDIREMLQKFTDTLHQDIAAEIMPVVMEEAGVRANKLFDTLRAKDAFFENWPEIKDVIDKKFTTKCIASSDDDDFETTIICKPKQCVINICMLSDISSSAKFKCDALHICKFFMLSECNDKLCRFGHDLRTEHNISVLKKQLLHRLTVKQLKLFTREKQNRNEATIPIVCKFYNRVGGCKHETMPTECTCIHVCRYYTQNKCKFGSTCKRSHDLFCGQPMKILKLYGLEQTPTEEILALLEKRADLSKHINIESNDEGDSLKLKEKIKNMLNENTLVLKENTFIDYIPIDRIHEQARKRYFTTDLCRQNENVKRLQNELTWGQGISLDQIQNNSSTETNILEESGSFRTDTDSTIIRATATEEELFNDGAVDDDTQSNNRMPGNGPAFGQNSEEIEEADFASNKYKNKHKYRHEGIMIENHLDERIEHTVQELMQTMLETIVNEEVKTGSKEISASPTQETTNYAHPREISSRSPHGISRDSKDINPLPGLQTVIDEPKDVISKGKSHDDSEGLVIKASPALELTNDAPRDQDSSGSIFGASMDLKEIEASPALEETNNELHNDVSSGSNHFDLEYYDTLLVLETTNRAPQNENSSNC